MSSSHVLYIFVDVQSQVINRFQHAYTPCLIILVKTLSAFWVENVTEMFGIMVLWQVPRANIS